MDRMLYVAMTGARQTMQAQTVNANNIANVNTTGFRQDLAAMRSMPVYGPGMPTRVYGMTEKPGTDLNPGSLMTTGRSLDVALKGQGWIAVQGQDGNEAYTRAGDLQVTSTGLLQTGAGHLVMGEAGPISLPPSSKVEIGGDGTISLIAQGDEAANMQEVDRIKLVNPPADELYKGEDGLMRLAEGEQAQADANVRLAVGALESSNVNIAEALVNMIDLARQFEMQVKMMKTAERNDQKAAQIMQMS
ncbi:flagellar basal-body rod protein FlgF [Thiohalophilus sp.]|uniref:flagellar basal-body rod protein FlgF n=1 Tax=Thiohalophilus sp. TaxID=3028392 RepID=UPI002ACED671|nr:flagellar basal-body rod protein FlgF [Thiohalophilus sp.]MDZ7802618.1 flagellar basal-body rod protein FlgF [Thiohalophilus sp.]